MALVGSSRWYPTPEQLAILREMYRGGVRTLSGSQIQEIAAHLSLYGRVESKNVFYWFQNRKARDRQKLRRKIGRQNKTTTIQQRQQQNIYPQVHPWFVPVAAHHLPHQDPPHSLFHGGMVETTLSTNLVCKEETSERREEKQPMIGPEEDWISIMTLDTKYRRPLITLELFPTRSNGDLK